MIAFYNGKFLDKNQIAISPDDRGFLFADGVYEVLRCYRGKLFELAGHLRRLSYGLDQLRIGAVDVPSIGRVMQRLIRENDLKRGDATVYLQVTRGSAPRLHPFPSPEIPPNVYAFAAPLQPNLQVQQSGANAILISDQRWARCDIKTTALVANVLASQRAKEAGAVEALLVRDGAILEGSRTNAMFVKDRTLFTAPLNNYILPGITRNVVLKLAKKLDIPVQERPIFESDLPDLEEAMIVGTTIEIAPLTHINGKPVGNGEPGPITRRLVRALQKLTE